MKFTNRIITLILAFALAFTMVCTSASAAKAEVYGLSGEFKDRMSLISYLDIADSTTQAEAKETTVLRGEFAINVAKMLNSSVDSNDPDRYFTDVPADHWAVGEINELVRKNIISVGEDKLFRPEEEITQTEALKMVLAACGYSDWANVNGGYPYGYTKAARMAGMTDYSADRAITAERAMDLIYEGLTIPIYDMTEFGDTIKYEALSDNLLSMYHKLYTAEGTVTYADGIAIDGGGNLDDGYVRLDGVKYKTDISMMAYIGQTKSFVYKKIDDSDNNREMVLLNSQNSNDKIITITKDEFIDYYPDSSTVAYYVKDKKQTASISESIIAVKNGQEYRNNTADAFDFNKGNITLIDTDDNNKYDYALVFEYKNYVVDRIDSMNKVIYDKTSFANSLNLKDDATDKKIVIEKGGARVGFDKIVAGDVVTAYESDVFVRAVITSNQVTGNLYNVAKDEMGRYSLNVGKVQSDAMDYTVDQDYFASAIKDSASFPLGASATYYIDAFGNIAYIQYGTGMPWQFAYLMNYSADTLFGTTVKLKLILQSGTVGVYEVSDRVIIDGVTAKDGNKVLTQLNKNRFNKAMSEGEDQIKGQLIRVKINSEDKISDIDTEYDDSQVEGSQSLKRTDKLQSLYYRYHPQSFNGKFVKNGNTICFLVPNYNSMSTSKDSDFRIIPANSTYFYSKTHLIEGFKLDQSGGAEDAIVMYASASPTLNSTFYLVDNVAESMNANGDVVKQLHLWASGVEYDFTCNDEYDLSVEVTENNTTNKYTVGEGDIIKISTNFDNEVVGAQIIYDYSRREDDDYKVAVGAKNSDYYTDQGNLFYMYVKSIKDNIIALSMTKPTEDDYILNPQKADYVTALSGKTIMIYDENSRGSKIYTGSLADIIPANKSGAAAEPYFLLANRGLIVGAIIYK